MEDKYWYALYTKPRHEFKAALDCGNLDIEYYLPTITKVKQWSDRKKKVTEPLLNGYIFVFVDEKERLSILQSKTIVKTVSFSGVPARIHPLQIENLKKFLEEEQDYTLENQLAIGTEIVVTDGPFKDVEGVVYQDENNEEMLAINIELLNRSVVVRLPSNSVTEKK